MDLRRLPEGLDAEGRVSARREIIEKELGVDLAATSVSTLQIGLADEKNCEQMFGAVPVPLGLAGPLRIQFSSGEVGEVYLPLATTEGALVASINRGCKAVSAAGGAQVTSEYVGITRSIAFEVHDADTATRQIHEQASVWRGIAESTSRHLKVLSYDVESKDGILFLTIAADTDEAMGMNMVTIAAQAVAEFLASECGFEIRAVAGNVDSDKKPSARTKRLGRGQWVHASAVIPDAVIRDVLKTDAQTILKTAQAKLGAGSAVAGALGANLHMANTIAALYLATGQDIAHVVEGSLGDTRVEADPRGIKIAVELTAVLVGVRGGGTGLPAQKQCLDLFQMSPKTSLRPTVQLAQIVGAAVLAGELSLLAALSKHMLAQSHKALGR